MAFKIHNYTILASYQYFGMDGAIHVYVAIESSPGKFKVYMDKETSFNPENFSMLDLLHVAKYGGKIGKESAERCFPIIAETYKFEG